MNYHRDKDYLVSEKQFRNIFKKRFNLICKHLAGGVAPAAHPRGGRCLEIGCSTGVMLDIFKEKGWKTWGVEPSGTAYRARRKGHRVFKTTFEKAKLPEIYFDLVVMNHTLEHMDKPLAVLAKVHKLLKPGAILFVDVPNAGGLGARILGKNWPYLLPKEHKHQFARQSLTSLLEKSGFEVIHWGSRSGLFEYANPLLELWQALTGLKKRFFTDIFTFPYFLIASVLNMGDSMSFLAKRNKHSLTKL